jgi:probable phosphoglycerate mutase
MQECVRAVLLTPEGQVLLMKVAGRIKELWITPGGRIHPGEQPEAALIREIREETGRTGIEIRGEIWFRYGTYLAGDRLLEERERFYLVPSERFEPVTGGMEAAEVNRHRGFRWWSIPEIVASAETFVPHRMAVLLRDLQDNGPPTTVIYVLD